MDLKKNALWNAFGNLTYLGLQWLITIFVVRANGYTDAGYLSLAMSLSSTFQNIAYYGIRNYQVSDIENKYNDVDYVMVRVITCTMSFLLCLLFVSVNSYDKMQAASIICFMVFRLVESFSDVLHGIAQKMGRLDIAGKSFFIRGIVSFLIFCSFYLIGKNLWVSLLGMAISSAICILFYDMSIVKKNFIMGGKLNFNKEIELMKECAPLCFYLLLFSMTLTIPRLFLERIGGTEVLGIYASVFAPTLLIQAGAGYIYMPLISAFTLYREENNKKAYYKLFIKISVILFLCFIIMVIAGTLFGNIVLQLMIGNQIKGYEYLLNGILCCSFLTAYTSFLCTLLTIKRNFKAILNSTICAVLCSAITSPILIQRYGAQGASDALILSLLLLCGLLWLNKCQKL